MKTKFETLDLRVRRMALAMAVPNTILGLLLALYTIYIVVTPFVLAPVVGYWLLYGYWRRFARHGKPMLWTWNLTIWFNLATVALPFLAPEVIEMPLFYVLLLWNGLMVVGAAFARKWDEALAAMPRRKVGEGWLERIEEELPA